MNRGRGFAAAGAALAFLAVAGGAFGAHLLEGRLPPSALDTFETAVRYQMHHAVGLLLVGIMIGRSAAEAFVWAGWLFLAGTIVFSGSLYLLVLSGWSWLGAVTPLGGLGLLGGWGALCWGLLTMPALRQAAESG